MLAVLDDVRAVKILLYLFIGAQFLELKMGIYPMFIRHLVFTP